jgi:hypothetical protein
VGKFIWYKGETIKYICMLYKHSASVHVTLTRNQHSWFHYSAMSWELNTVLFLFNLFWQEKTFNSLNYIILSVALIASAFKSSCKFKKDSCFINMSKLIQLNLNEKAILFRNYCICFAITVKNQTNFSANIICVK